MNWTKGMRFLDRTADLSAQDPLFAFALDEAIGYRVNERNAPVCHLWRHPQAFLLGSRDVRLPNAAEAIRWLEGSGYRVAVRNSGGAAVPLDESVVNVSLVLPPARDGTIYLEADFGKMVDLLLLTLAHMGLEGRSGEVAGSYCPGTYDLSLDGRKFCGISQRRQKQAIIVNAFVLTEGLGTARARLARAFYDRAVPEASGQEDVTAAACGSNASLCYPLVRSDSMISLREKTPEAGTTAFAEALKATVRGGRAVGDAGAELEAEDMPTPEEMAERLNKLRQRYPLPR